MCTFLWRAKFSRFVCRMVCAAKAIQNYFCLKDILESLIRLSLDHIDENFSLVAALSLFLYDLYGLLKLGHCVVSSLPREDVLFSRRVSCAYDPMFCLWCSFQSTFSF